MSRKTPQFPAFRPPSKRLVKLCARHLRLRAKGIEKFEQSRAALNKAISAGLMTDQPIEVGDGEKFILVDNFAGPKTGGWATVSRFELKKLSKKRESEISPTAEIGA